MPSTTDGSSRDLRDRPLVRLAVLVAVLAFAFLYVRGCGSTKGDISSARAVEIARAEASFTPDRHGVRLVQRGLPPRAFWGVSLVQDGPDGTPRRVEVYLIDTRTGDVTRG